ncbi:uncharacterized protein LOC123320831 [Coccinella septempunctata]|uniref:uncharacterized protein LOC123320831 n=1 Tax=Coccinella septempunctata TaxID=41139 RepID=UPI001D07B652|nr:uncharacterized protein LOC123320831 [Coccinella septempunctata]
MEESFKGFPQFLCVFLIFSIFLDDSKAFTIRRQTRTIAGFPLRIRTRNFIGKYGNYFIHNMNKVPFLDAVESIKEKLVELDEEISDGLLDLFGQFEEMEREVWGA